MLVLVNKEKTWFTFVPMTIGELVDAAYYDGHRFDPIVRGAVNMMLNLMDESTPLQAVGQEIEELSELYAQFDRAWED